MLATAYGSVHHDPSQASRFLIGVLIGVGVVILAVLIRPLVNKLFFFDWPALYEWQQARRQLRLIDRWRVIWATRRHHPASRAALAGAQLAYARYVQAAAQRNMRGRMRRVVLAGIFGVNASLWAVAAAHGRQRIADSVLAACFAICALGWAVLIPLSEKHFSERMAQLHAEIERDPRYSRRAVDNGTQGTSR